MTFMEMINLLDEKHKARREVWQAWLTCEDDDYFLADDFIKYRYYFHKECFLATDWIVEEI